MHVHANTVSAWLPARTVQQCVGLIQAGQAAASCCVKAAELELQGTPVPLSSAPTLRMPLASISKVTSIWGVPRGAGGMLVRSNCPSLWLSLVIARSPSNTCS